MWYAHSLPNDEDKSHWQPLACHLKGVSTLSACFGAKFRAESAATLAGLLHDLGKYTLEFQCRLEGGERVDHATAGAQEIVALAAQASDRCIAEIIAHAIAGHHAGMPNSVGETSLDARLRKLLPALDPIWRNEITPIAEGLTPAGFSWRDNGRARQLAFFGRMIFSCLVDADYRDTAAFYNAARGEKIDRDWPRLRDNIDDYIERFDRYMEKKPRKDTPVNVLRAEILSHTRARAQTDQGLFTLTVPTGGGKTLASLAFALDHAKRHGLERIVYAIPFTSIIDQTAAIFREVLGEDVVLEHHSSIDEERIANEDREHRREAIDKLKLAMEDWAAPVVVTTNVQLFESLHSNRPSRCRKLHNLANCVIVLDEAQTIPLALLRPCLDALDELARNYGASIVLCTATQPAVAAPEFPGGLDLGPERELAPNPARLHQDLKRVQLKHLGDKTDDELVAALGDARQGLMIVNSRKHALALYRKAVECGLDGVIHLTTRQYAAHRRRILADVRQRLKDGAPCRLIATSLVEAGVDLDFPRVWRAEAGLDQIAQAAGRCNREGGRPLEDSIVGVFRSSEHKPPREIGQLAGDMGRMMGKHADLLSPEAMRDYFGEVYWRKGEALDKHKIGEAWLLSRSTRGPYPAPSFNYRTVAENFRMIESGLAPVIVAFEEAPREVLAALRGGLPPGAAARRLQSFIVQVPPKARDLLLRNEHVRFVEGFGDQFVVMENGSLYGKDTGLLWENAEYLGIEGPSI
jgi:CRISPR-associated endonuclease/helicase Cas3